MTQVDDRALATFKREERYVVIKLSHFDQPNAIKARVLEAIDWRRIPGKAGLIDCVVVEHDWPEYEPVWAMIEARCTPVAAQGDDVSGTFVDNAWRKYEADFNGMSDAEIDSESEASRNQINEAEDWLEAVASWEAAGKPRGATLKASSHAG